MTETRGAGTRGARRPVATRLADALELGSLIASQVFMWAMVAIMAFEVVMRYGFNRPTGFADELGGYFLAGLVMTGIVYTFRADAHVRVDILLESMSPVWCRRLVRALNVAAIPALLLLAWLSLQMTLDFYRSGRRSFASVLQTPLWIPVALVPLGLVALMVLIAATLREPRDPGSDA